jgi:hypothetical protein
VHAGRLAPITVSGPPRPHPLRRRLGVFRLLLGRYPRNRHRSRPSMHRSADASRNGESVSTPTSADRTTADVAGYCPAAAIPLTVCNEACLHLLPPSVCPSAGLLHRRVSLPSDPETRLTPFRMLPRCIHWGCLSWECDRRVRQRRPTFRAAGRPVWRAVLYGGLSPRPETGTESVARAGSEIVATRIKRPTTDSWQRIQSCRSFTGHRRTRDEDSSEILAGRTNSHPLVQEVASFPPALLSARSVPPFPSVRELGAGRLNRFPERDENRMVVALNGAREVPNTCGLPPIRATICSLQPLLPATPAARDAS